MRFFLHMFQNSAQKAFTKNLQDGERIVHVFRSHPMKHAVAGFIIALFVLVPLFFLVPLVALGDIGFFILLACFALAVFLALREIYIWRLHAFLLTNWRIVDHDQYGIFGRTVSECRFDKIQDVRYTKKGILSTFLGLGNVVIQTAGSDVSIELDLVQEPEHVQKLIAAAQETFARGDKVDDMRPADFLGYVRGMKMKEKKW